MKIESSFGFVLALSMVRAGRGLAAPHKIEFSARSIGRNFAKCLGQSEIGLCFTDTIKTSLDAAIRDNSTWHLSDNIDIELNPDYSPQRESKDHASLSDMLANKLASLTSARSIRMSVSKPEPNLNEERKKKDKGGMAVMGGMAMMAMFAQMFLMKVLLIAGAAFVMSKIALLVSVFSSLKKATLGSTTEHVLYSGNSHDHSHTGFHRSLPQSVPANPAEELITVPPEVYHYQIRK